MNIEFINPGVDYMIQRIWDFQTESESAFWSEPLYHFYPQLDKAYATSLPFAERKRYLYILSIGSLANRRLQQPYRMLLMWIVLTYLTIYGAI